MSPHQSSILFVRTLRSICALVFLAVAFGSSAEVTTVVSGSQCAVPERDVKVVDNTITVCYDFPEIREVTVASDSSLVYHSIPGFGQCSEAGKPMLPMRIDTFRVPFGYEVSIAVTNGESKSVSCRYAGSITQLTDSSNESPVFTEITPYEGVFPLDSGSILSTYTLREETLVEVTVSPVQYDYGSETATIYRTVSYSLTFTPKESVLIADSSNESTLYSDRYLEEFLSNSLVVNPSKIGGANLQDSDGFEGSVGYIIVTTDEYLDAVKNFERWKNILGYTTYILSRTEWTNASEVLVAIRECRRMNDNIQYLIIFGDNDDVPSMDSNRCGYPHKTDSYFGTLPSTGYKSDIYIGRVPVGSLGEANVIINKIVRTEMCPVQEEAFYKNAIHCAKFEIGEDGNNVEDRRFVLTSEEIRNYVKTKGIDAQRFYSAASNANPQFYSNYYSFGQAIPAELQRPSFSWTCNPADIVSKFNEGCFYAFYRGHGNVSGWQGVGFNVNTLANLDNYEICPTVFSISCLTGKFDENCFAEELLRYGMSGASSVIAASQVSYSSYNDSLIEGIIDAIWPNPGIIPKFNVSLGSVSQTPEVVNRLGPILEQGLFRMNEQWGSYSKEASLYQYEVYHIFGDPSMYFFTEKPTTFSDVEILRDETGIHVSTNGEIASISFFNPDSGAAYKYETSEIFFSTDDAENTIVCLSGYNHLTYLDGTVTPISEDSELKPSIIRCTSNDNATASVKILSGNLSRNVSVSISDVNGNYIYSMPVVTEMNAADFELPMPDLGGVYVISLCVDGMVVDTKKIIK